MTYERDGAKFELKITDVNLYGEILIDATDIILV